MLSRNEFRLLSTQFDTSIIHKKLAPLKQERSHFIRNCSSDNDQDESQNFDVSVNVKNLREPAIKKLLLIVYLRISKSAVKN